jgi:hypothetical protein
VLAVNLCLALVHAIQVELLQHLKG